MFIDRKIFFDEYRKAFGSLTQTAADGLEFLLGKFEEGGWQDIRLISYVLSTVKHESAGTYQPIKEYRSRVDSKGRANQDRYWKTGFYGRGYVQLTHERNYKLLGEKVSADLIKNPDLALVPEIAFEILVVGMLQGLFTGKKLSDYINSKQTDYRGARRVVNGTDKDTLIASYAKNFYAAISFTNL